MKVIFLRRTTRATLAACICVAGSACASKPVEVTSTAIVTLDTTRRPAAKLRKPAPARNFWGAMTNLDPDYVTTYPASPDEREFAGALRLIMSGDADEAELSLDSLARHSTDSIVRSASHILLTAALQYQNKWKELAEIAPPRRLDMDPADIDRAGVELWAAAFKNVPSRQVSFPLEAVVVPLTLSATGTPVIPVQVNGKLKQLWLDTGSSMSIVASDVAAECGVEPLVSDTLEVATSTGRVTARPAALHRLDIGGISISSSTAMIVASRLMEVRVGDLQNPSRTAKIDGIVGFDIISQLNIQVDFAKNLVTLTKPVRAAPNQAPQRNFFWVGTPIVRLVSQRGVPVYLGLDTGAQETFASERLLEKVRVRTFVGERKRVGGFAGLREFRGRFISDLRLALGGKTLLFEKLLVFVPAVSTFVNLDGVLGSDIGRAGVMRIDAVNGVFTVEASPFERRSGSSPILRSAAATR